MRLLILTQTVDDTDPTLGFFHEWIAEFARHCEGVLAICLFEGEYAFPENVRVLSLGKEKRGKAGGKNAEGIFPASLPYLYRFFTYIWKYRNDYDAVFVHMNQQYVLFGGLFWRLWRKRVCLWYAHGAVSFSLRLAEKIARAVFTSTAEGFRITSKKLHIVGQGIDVASFTQCVKNTTEDYRQKCIRIVYVGRIAPVKRGDVLLEAAKILKARGEHFFITFVGDVTSPTAREYHTVLQERARVLGISEYVTFLGGVSHRAIGQYLQDADVFVNPSETGSLDKAGLEALAAGVSLITCNEAYRGVLGVYKERLMFRAGDADDLAEKIIALHRAPDRQDMIDMLTEVVEREHNLSALIPRICAVIKGSL